MLTLAIGTAPSGRQMAILMNSVRVERRSLHVLSIPMRRRLRNYQKMNLFPRVVPHLVRSSRGNPNPFSGAKNHRPIIHFHRGLAREHVEELLRVMMEVANLGRSRRHSLLNDA